MGRIVGGFGTSHVLFPPDGVEAQAGRVIEGLLEIRRRVQALAPDLIVLASADHLNNFTLATQVTLAVGIADEFESLRDGGLPSKRFKGQRSFAEGFARLASRRGYDLVQVEEVRPDHGMMIPKLIIDPKGAIPTVPVFINAAMPVPPSPGRCHALGGVLKEMVETQRPEDERVVVVGAGGLSHWLCLPEQGRINADFDQDFIQRMIEGRSDELGQMETDEIVVAAGNGGLEVICWLFMAGALPKARGERLFYEAIAPWISGMGGLALSPAL